ncbi:MULTISPECIES: GNAT family N-acetyltransferase [unclassified Aureimonas]|uniref:GNAT family N-acetyltransferase n=1 Tax=unclassified Aureimonas TaxID=2615206 RepID=UPI0006FD0BF6|nr:MULTISPECIES: GNAT family N-acetyltransferase [unclassified Aureimonas]KQT65797.1 hypothetical protein ASG62_21750 [Aureimonas sp. Leaf427]KQT74796.1 hypothetical protein ASG54_16810 [Aureimonas sp. Leaf460]
MSFLPQLPLPAEAEAPLESSSVEPSRVRSAQVPTRGSAGETIVLRSLRSDETALFTEHLARLDPETRRLRFGNPVNDTFLSRYADLALSSDAVIKGCFVDGVLRGVGELRFLSGDRADAEGAFCLERPFQGRGLGDRLFERLVTAARNRGVHRLFLTCLRENRRMQRIADHHGAELSFTGSDVIAEIRRPYADAGSVAREWRDESEAFVFAMLDWRRRGLGRLAAPFRRLAAGFRD